MTTPEIPATLRILPETEFCQVEGVSLPVMAVHRASGILLSLIPSGRFTMGSPDDIGDADEHPAHDVELSRPFYLGTYPVTVAQWRQHGADIETPSREGVTGFEDPEGIVEWRHDPHASTNDPLPYLGFRPSDDHPVTQVSWLDAQEFCRRMDLRLPTEAEFEWALRSGTASPYWWGDDPAQANGRGNYSDRAMRARFRHWRVDGELLDLPHFSHDDGFVFTSPVGTFEPNPFGLHDVGGNVWEWCEDSYDPAAYQHRRRDGHQAWAADLPRRVLRGASWDNGPWGARSARRYHESPDLRLVNVGFRVACDLDSA